MMKRLTVLLMAVGVTLAMVIPASAHDAKNGSSKQTIYDSVPATCHDGATDTSAPAGDSFVVLNLAGNPNATGAGSKTVIANIQLKGVMPNTKYRINVNQHPGPPPTGCPSESIATLETNKKGKGHINVKVPWNGTADHFWVGVTSVTGVPPSDEQFLRSTSAALK